jgi:hypothetical protein
LIRSPAVNNHRAMSSTSPPSFLQRITQLFKGSSTTRPDTERYGDGRADSEVDPAALKASILKVLASQAKRAPENLHLLLETLALKAQGGYDDDSKYVVSFTAHEEILNVDGTSYSTCCFVARWLCDSNETYKFVYL